MDTHYLHQIGKDGIIIPEEQMRKSRIKKGECPNCGIKLFKIKIFGNLKLSIPGKVDNGKCLGCCPQVKVAGISRSQKKSTHQTKNPYRHSTGSSTSSNPPSKHHNRKSALTASGSLEILDSRSSIARTGNRSKNSVGPFSSSNPPSKSQNRKSAPTASGSLEVLDSLSTCSIASTRKRSSRQHKLPHHDSGTRAGSNTNDTNHYSDRTRNRNNLQQKTPHLESCISFESYASDDSDISFESNTSDTNHDIISIRENNVISDSNLGLTPKLDLENPRSIIKTLENNSSSGMIQEQALKALLNFQLSQIDKKEIVNCGGVEAIIAGLENHESNNDIQLYACKILCKLCTVPGSLTVILESGGIKAVVNAMQSFPEDNKIEESCLSTLSFVFEKNHRIVMKILENNLSSVLVQERALKALLKFQLSQADKLEIVNNNGIKIVIAGMEHQESSHVIQLNACKVLLKLSALSDSPTVIWESGGIKAVVNAMKRFPMDVEIQEFSLSILLSVGLLEVVLKSGGIQSVISAMNEHPGSVEVQTSGCAILSGAKLLGDDIKENVGEIGGINAAAFALMMNPGDKKIAIKALSAISGLCANHDRNMDRLNSVEVDGIDSIISVMHYHRNDSDIQEAGAQALSIFGGNNKNRYILKRKGGLDVLLLSLSVHTEHIGVQEYASNALWVLSMGVECRNTIIDLDGIRAATEVLEKYTENSKIVENLFSLLSSLASKDQISKVNIVKTKALDDIVMVMILHSENMNIQIKACTLLKDLLCESNVKPIIASNVSGCMVCASATFPECQQDTDYVLCFIQ